MTHSQIGIIGLGVMGSNLAQNIARQGYKVAVYNRTEAVTGEFIKGLPLDSGISAVYSYEDLAATLEKPRRILMMVKAGQAVDAVIGELLPYLEAGDVLMDGGNSYFADTDRRVDALAAQGLHYLGVGVSGGEEGALWGPSIMPGGDKVAWDSVSQIFMDVAARADDGEPCVAYLGPRGAGHYVKMVHNGIEYGDMQLIAEAYDLLHRGLDMSYDQLGDLFHQWNEGKLSSFLIEITARIFHTADAETGGPLLELILDEAQQKGTGKWISQNAFDLGVPTHTINAAVTSRIISGMKEERIRASQKIAGPDTRYSGDHQQLIDALQEALYASKVISYAQGFGLMALASEVYGYELDMKTIAKIWRAGCIIRADLLDDIMSAFDRNSELENLLLDDYFNDLVVRRQGALRYVLSTAVQLGIPVYAMSASLAYFDALRTPRLPANLTQAQRDFFGAHTYRRIDREGIFHTDWSSAA